MYAAIVLAPVATMLVRSWEGDLHRDEVLYAAIAKGITVRHEWLDLYVGDEAYWKKPPLVFWLVAAAFRILGVSTLAAHLVPAVFGILSCVALFAVTRRLFSDRVAFVAAIALATTPRFLHSGSTLNLDTPVVFFTLAALFCFVRRADGPATVDLVCAGAAWGLAVMTKGGFGLLAPLVCVLYIGIVNRRALHPAGFAIAAAVALVICLPWHVHEMLRWGPDFVRTYLGQEILERAAGRLWPDQKIDRYSVELLRDDWPWLIPTLIGLVPAVRGARRGQRAALFVLVWAIGYLAALHLSAFRRGQYLMHFYPPAAILAAFGVEAIFPVAWWRPLPRLATAVSAVVALALVVAPFRVHPFMANDVKELGPLLDRVSPAQTSVAGFQTNPHLRASTLLYLDRDVHNVELADLPRVHPIVVVTEPQFKDQLERAGFTLLHANRHFALFTPGRDDAVSGATRELR